MRHRCSADRERQHIDYCLNILGIRVQEISCHILAKGDGNWASIGPRWDLPIHIPQNEAELRGIGTDNLAVTAQEVRRHLMNGDADEREGHADRVNCPERRVRSSDGEPFKRPGHLAPKIWRSKADLGFLRSAGTPIEENPSEARPPEPVELDTTRFSFTGFSTVWLNPPRITVFVGLMRYENAPRG